MGRQWFIEKLAEHDVRAWRGDDDETFCFTDFDGIERKVLVPGDGYIITTECIERAKLLNATDLVADQWFSIGPASIAEGKANGIRVWKAGIFLQQFD